MISPKQKILNDMIDAVIHYSQADDSLECLLIAAVPVESGDIEVKTAANCKPETAHFFGHGVADLANEPVRSGKQIRNLIVGGISCSSLRAELLQILNTQEPNTTCH